MNLITIKETASKLKTSKVTVSRYMRKLGIQGVSKAGTIYLNSDEITRIHNAKKLISKKITKNHDAPHVAQHVAPQDHHIKNANSDLIDSYKEQLIFLRDQISKKDVQIDQLQQNQSGLMQSLLIEKKFNNELSTQVKMLEDKPPTFNEKLLEEALSFSMKIHDEINQIN